jgi:hypothetical protein
MVGKIAAISLVTVVMMGLSWITLTDLAPWAILSLALVAFYLIGKEIQQHADADSRARWLCNAFPALRRLP